jgi:hypothetical protein
MKCVEKMRYAGDAMHIRLLALCLCLCCWMGSGASLTTYASCTDATCATGVRAGSVVAGGVQSLDILPVQ